MKGMPARECLRLLRAESFLIPQGIPLAKGLASITLQFVTFEIRHVGTIKKLKLGEVT